MLAVISLGIVPDSVVLVFVALLVASVAFLVIYAVLKAGGGSE